MSGERIVGVVGGVLSRVICKTLLYNTSFDADSNNHCIIYCSFVSHNVIYDICVYGLVYSDPDHTVVLY